MDTLPPAPEKKGLSTIAWVGIGCGGVLILIVIALVAMSVLFGAKLKEFADEAQKNPTRAMATTMVTVSAGNLELIAEDEALKRYTVRDKKTGALTTIYWNQKTDSPEVIEGDFSAIPAETPEPEPN